MPQGYDGLPSIYVTEGAPLTPNLGLSLTGADPIVAENFWLIDVFAAGGGGGSSKWSSLTNAVANLTLNNAGFTTTFNQTSAVQWLWDNTTAATSHTPTNSPVLALGSTIWNGSASIADKWTFQSIPDPTINNGTVALKLLHTGSAGMPLFSVGDVNSLSAAAQTFFSNGSLNVLGPFEACMGGLQVFSHAQGPDVSAAFIINDYVPFNDTCYGLSVWNFVNNTTGSDTTDAAYGAQIQVEHQGANAVATLIGLSVSTESDGTQTNPIATQIAINVQPQLSPIGGPLTTTTYGIQIEDPNGAGQAGQTNYGIFFEPITTTGGTTTWAIFEDSTCKNQFGPSTFLTTISIGSTNPTVLQQITGGNTVGGLLLNTGADWSGLLPPGNPANLNIGLWVKGVGNKDTYAVFQAGTSAEARDYLAFVDRSGNYRWLMGKNAGAPLVGTQFGQFILYDATAGVHRMVCQSDGSGSGGPTYINSSGTHVAVIINGYNGLDTPNGTGGLQVWDGNGTSAAEVWGVDNGGLVTMFGSLQFNSDNSFNIGHTGTTNRPANIYVATSIGINNDVFLETNGSGVLCIGNSGAADRSKSVGCASVQLPTGSTSTNSIQFNGVAGLGIHSIGTTSNGGIIFSANGVDLMQIDYPFGLNLMDGNAIGFSATTIGSRDATIARLGPASFSVGNATAGDFTGSMKFKSLTLTDTSANTDLTLQNTTAATSGTSQSSPLMTINGTYWTGSASATDSWTIQVVETNGTNGASTLTFGHSGTTGATQVVIPSSIRNSANGTPIVTSAAGSGSLSFIANNVLSFTLGGGQFVQWNNGNGSVFYQEFVVNSTVLTWGDIGIYRFSSTTLGVSTNSTGAGNTSGSVLANSFGIGLVSTSAITGAVPVKADTSNANQVVVTTTSDTGSGVVIGVCSNSPGAAGVANVVTTGVVAMTLGTGTASIGQFVIVDTTTNGRVKCTSSYSAGTVIGVAMSAQASVGSTFNVMVGLR